MNTTPNSKKSRREGKIIELDEDVLLNALQDEMSSLHEVFKCALSALECGLLPDNNFPDEVAQAINNAYELRGKLSETLFTDTASENELSLQFLSKAVETKRSAAESRQLLESARHILGKFAYLYSNTERHEAALHKLRQRVASHTDDDIKALIEVGELANYECFLLAVTDGIRDDATEARLADSFGDTLVAALARKTIQFCITEDNSPEGVPATPGSAGKPAIDNAVQENYGIDDDERESPEDYEDEDFDDEDFDDFEALLDLNDYGIILPEDSTYGILNAQVSGKTPKGVKAFLSDLDRKPEKFVTAVHFIVLIMLDRRATSLNELTLRKPSDYDFSGDILSALDFIWKEGYIARYTLSTDDTSHLYCLTAPGEKVLLSQSVRSFFKLPQKYKPRDRKILSAADFLRLRCIGDTFLDCMQSRYELENGMQNPPEFFTTQVNSLSLGYISPHGQPSILLIPCFFSNEEEVQLDSLIVTITDEYKPDTQIRIIAASPELESAWQRVFRGELAGVVDPENIVLSSQEVTRLVAGSSMGSEPEAVPKPQPKQKQAIETETGTDIEQRKSQKKKTGQQKNVQQPKSKSRTKPEQKAEGKSELLTKIVREQTPDSIEPDSTENVQSSAESPSNPQIAAALLLEGTTGVAPPIAEVIGLMMLQAECGQWAELLTLTKALSIAGPSIYKSINRRFEYATNVLHDPSLYCSEKLRFLDTDSEEMHGFVPDDFLLYSSLSIIARACFAPAVMYDRELEAKVKQSISLLESRAHVCELKNLFTCFLNLHKEHPSGFSDRTLQTLLKNEDRMRKISDTKRRAGDLLTSPNLLVRMDGAGRLKDELFGPHSDLRKALTVISAGDESRKDEVIVFYNRFCGNPAEQSAFDEKKVSDFIHEKWSKVRDTRSAKSLAHDLYDKVYNNLVRRLDVMYDWLDLISQGVDNPERLLQHAEIIGAAINKSILELNAKETTPFGARASHALLRYTLGTLLKTLSGDKDGDSITFISLLGAPYIGLNDKEHPHFYEALNELPGCEPWRLALKSIVYDKISPETAIEYINDRDNAEWFSNYGTADCLQKKFITDAAKRVDYSKSVRFATEDAEREVNKTYAYLDLSLMNGCIEEQTREAADMFITGFKDAIIQSRDFARLHMFLREIRKWVEKDREKISQGLRDRLDALRTSKEPDAAASIDSTIEKGLLSAAEDCINRLESDDFSCADETCIPFNPIDVLKPFLDKYKLLYDECRRKRDNNFMNWAYSSVEQNCADFLPNPDEWLRQNGKSSEEFIKSWLAPGRNRSAQEERIMKLMKCIFGLLVRRVTAYTDDRAAKSYEIYEMATVKAPRNRADYEHPISLFGTCMPSRIKIVPLYAVTSAEQIYSRVVTDLRIDGDAIVLVDGALSFDERRELARKFKPRMSGTVIVLDHVLMLYLAMREEPERLKTLLICSLPYAYYRPYSNDGAAVTDEMFMGRKSELSDIRNMAGACLVYGGRQLGKTSLLSRACSIEHNPEQKEYALHIDIENIGVKDLAKKLTDELISCGIRMDATGKPSVASVCSTLNHAFRNGDVKKLILALDEADHLLDEDRRDKYKVLQQFVSLRQQTTNRFKCVFAGLHNAMRSRDAIADNNSPLAKLGKPLCIKPLSQSDAQQLVRYPLAYLGYEISDNQLATILSATINYPGIIHLFCYELIKDVSEKHNTYYIGGIPPFKVDDKVLGGVISSVNLKDRVRDKIHMTLRMDDRYWKLANIIALLCYEKLGYNDSFSIGKIIEETMEFFRSNSNYGPETIATLLDEMCGMGILSPGYPHGELLYRFRKNQFLRMIGSEDEVTQILVEG